MSKQVVAYAACAAAALVVALLLAGADRGLALYAYVLFLGAVATIALTGRIDAVLSRTPNLDRLGTHAAAPDRRLPQLEGLTQRLSGGQSSAFEVHYRLRPLIREIAAARLARQHGVELDREPGRAETLVGARLWELVRPDREAPVERLAAGWSVAELSLLIDELEAI